jgi:hypothetical protein
VERRIECRCFGACRFWAMLAPFLHCYALGFGAPFTAQLQECKGCCHRFSGNASVAIGLDVLAEAAPPHQETSAPAPSLLLKLQSMCSLQSGLATKAGAAIGAG